MRSNNYDFIRRVQGFGYFLIQELQTEFPATQWDIWLDFIENDDDDYCVVELSFIVSSLSTDKEQHREYIKLKIEQIHPIEEDAYRKVIFSTIRNFYWDHYKLIEYVVSTLDGYTILAKQLLSERNQFLRAELLDFFSDDGFNHYDFLDEQGPTLDCYREWRDEIVGKANIISKALKEGSADESSFDFNQESPLKALGYTVGTSGWSERKRQLFLAGFLCRQVIPDHKIYDWSEWGAPGSAARKQKMINHLSGLASLAERKQNAQAYSKAIQHWQEDAAYVQSLNCPA